LAYNLVYFSFGVLNSSLAIAINWKWEFKREPC